MDDPRDPSLESLLELHREVTLAAMYIMLPGIVLSYNETKQTAVVQPAVKRRRLAEDGETWIAESVPPIHGVPVEFIGPARGRMTWPVAANDVCEIRWASSSLARWLAAGPGVVDPGDDRAHDPTDAICFVGLHSPAAPPTDAPTDAIVLHVSGGVVVKVGDSSASAPLTRTGDVQSALIGALTDAGIVQGMYNYGIAITPADKTAALASLVVAVNTYFGTHGVTGSPVIKST